MYLDRSYLGGVGVVCVGRSGTARRDVDYESERRLPSGLGLGAACFPQALTVSWRGEFSPAQRFSSAVKRTVTSAHRQ